MKVTQQSRLTEALLNGEQLTVPQMAARFNMANPTAVISNIRFSGYAVYVNRKKNSKGVSVSRYRIGTPSRELIAAGYRALSLGLVD
jgi:hypothetical protein